MQTRGPGVNGLARFRQRELEAVVMTTIIRLVLLGLALGTPAAAQEVPPAPKPLSLEQRTALKCSAAFAIGAVLQQRGGHADWPPLAARGREFFVRVSAQVMDETGRNREQVASELTAEARELADPAALSATMPPCLLLLDASGI